jgi:outer membrane receptor protein involved in Fe transport
MTMVVAMGAAVLTAAPASAQQSPVKVDVRSQPLGQALRTLAHQAGIQIVFDETKLADRRSPAVSGTMPATAALDRLLRHSGLSASRTEQGVFVVAARPAVLSPAGLNTVGQSAASEQQRAAVISGEPPLPQADEGGEVIVTGTRITRPNLKSASPITSVTSAEIKAQGAVNLEEVTNRLGQVQPDAQQNYQQSNGQQRGVKLRGLDFNRTLSLINGQRIAGTESVDTNLIPVSLVERIDLLTGGASSVYGSDAIAGVVNYVIRRDFTGLQLSANYSFYNHNNRDNVSTPVAQRYGITTPRGMTNDGGRADLSATYGHNFLDDRLNVSVYGTYRTADGILFRERDASGCQLRRDAGNPLRVNNLICGVTAASPNGTLTANGANYSNVTGSPGVFAPASTVPGYPNQGDRLAARGYERYNAGGFINFKASPAAEISLGVMYLHDKSANLLYGPYVQGSYRVNCDNPFLSRAQAQTICGARAGTAAYAPLGVQYGFPGLAGDRDKETFTNTQTRINASVRGEIAEGWHYDIGGVYDESRQLWKPGGNPVGTKVARALDIVNVGGVPTCRSVVDGTDPSCVPLNVFVANNPGSAALSNYLFNEGLGVSDLRAKFYDVTANLTADLTRYGITSPFAEQGLAIAIGAEYRKQQERGLQNSRFIEVYGGVADRFATQDVIEGNVEAQLPLVQNVTLVKLLQVNGGYRLSKYSTNSKTFSTWKIEAVYSPSEDITFRFGRNRAARAPGLREANQTIGFQNATIVDPCASIDGVAPRASREACRLTGLPDNLYGNGLAAGIPGSIRCIDDVCRQRNNGVPIDPEDARTTTYGFVLTPRFIPRLSLSVDRYKIQVDSVISYLGASFAVDGCAITSDPYYCSRLVRDPTTYQLTSSSSSAGYIQGGNLNAYRLYAAGYDFQAQYSIPLGGTAGKLDLLMNGTLTTDQGGQAAVNLPRTNCVGYFGGSCPQPAPRWIHNVRATYSSDNQVFSASLAWRYIDGTTAGQNGGPNSTPATAVTDFTRIAPYNYVDLALGFNITKQLTLTAAVNNIFDRQQPILTNTYDDALSRGNTIPQRYDTLGRQISISATTRF